MTEIEKQKIDEIARAVTPVLKKYGINRAGIFGSYARGDARPDSDLDILVSFGSRPLSLWDVAALKDELSSSVHKPVDVVSETAVISYFRDYIYKDLKIIYG